MCDVSIIHLVVFGECFLVTSAKASRAIVLAQGHIKRILSMCDVSIIHLEKSLVMQHTGERFWLQMPITLMMLKCHNFGF